MQQFNFEYLIKKYSTEFVIVTHSDGDYDEYGERQAGIETKTTLTGAIISHRQSKIFKSEGTLTEQDRALYMLSPLDKSLQGAKVIYEGQKYSISSELQNANFTGVYAYLLKFVSPFSEVKQND